MKIEEFEQLAHNAVTQYEKSPFKLTDRPMASFGVKTKLPADFPIPHKYLGCNRWGNHCYLLDAQAILQYTARYRQEFKME